MHRSSSPKPYVLAAALALAAPLAGCGGSSDGGAAAPEGVSTTAATGSSTTAPAAASTTTAGAEASGGGCTVDGEARGDAASRWIAVPATVSLDNAGGGPPAFYSSEQRLRKLYLYAEGAAPASVIFTSITDAGVETTFTSAAASTGLDVAADGSGATVDADLESADGATVHAKLTVTC